MTALVRYEVRADAAWLTLDEPARRNVLSDALVGDLLAALRRALDDPAVRVLVLTGAPPAFCAGADLRAGGVGTGTAAENPFVQVLRTIWEAPKPVVGRINGAAFGGGVGLAAACDLTVASDAAVFAFSEVRVGVVPAIISVLVVPKIGIQQAMWLFLTGERFSAARAAEVGLVHRVVPAADLDAAVEEVVGLVRLGGPTALREAKALVRRIPALDMDAGFAYATRTIAELFASDEAAEGMQAFLAKRRPRWAE
jgi:methylglutaconyl-CoA hydratase